MKRNLYALIFCVTAMIAYCQTNDTAWTEDFTSSKLDETYWNYETRSITDLILYKPEFIMQWDSYINILYNHNKIEGHRFGAGGINTENKALLSAGQSVVYVTQFPSLYCGVEQGIKFRMAIANQTDTIGFETIYIENYDLANENNNCKIYSNLPQFYQRNLKKNEISVDNKQHEYKIQVCNDKICFYFDNEELGNIEGDFLNKQFWLLSNIEVEELGQPFWEIDYSDPEWSNIDVYTYCQEMYIHKVSVITNANCDDIENALEEVPAEELMTITDGVLTLKRADVNAVSAIFSADGRQVMSFTGGTADISSLPQGLYVLRTASANGKNLTAKFVK